jgi:hypothetical protein
MRHEVFDDAALTRRIAHRLGSAEQVKRARAFPYQLLMAYKQADPKLPRIVREALQDAMEAAIANVPAIDGKVYLLPDVSGSMHSPVTGHRRARPRRSDASMSPRSWPPRSCGATATRRSCPSTTRCCRASWRVRRRAQERGDPRQAALGRHGLLGAAAATQRPQGEG